MNTYRIITFDRRDSDDTLSALMRENWNQRVNGKNMQSMPTFTNNKTWRQYLEELELEKHWGYVVESREDKDWLELKYRVDRDELKESTQELYRDICVFDQPFDNMKELLKAIDSANIWWAYMESDWRFDDFFMVFSWTDGRTDAMYGYLRLTPFNRIKLRVVVAPTLMKLVTMMGRSGRTRAGLRSFSYTTRITYKAENDKKDGNDTDDDADSKPSPAKRNRKD